MNTPMAIFKPGNIPRFDESNYVYWSKRMQAHLIALGFEIWRIVRDGYKDPKDGPSTSAEITGYENNAKAVNAILGVLNESE